jgi:hypothetical protein
VPYALPPGFTAVQVAAGRSHACALSTAGAVACWGAGGSGQIGQINNTATPVLVNLGAGVTATALAAGGDTTCVLTSTGNQLCIGSNAYSQMGLGLAAGSVGANTTPQQALPAAGAAVPLGPATPPAFVTISRGAQSCKRPAVGRRRHHMWAFALGGPGGAFLLGWAGGWGRRWQGVGGGRPRKRGG